MVMTRRCDSVLGSWTQSHWEPARGDPLTGIVERIWDFDGTLAHRRERIFPNGMLELVVRLDEPRRPVSGRRTDRFRPFASTVSKASTCWR